MNAKLTIKCYDESTDQFFGVLTDDLGPHAVMINASLLPFLIPTEECPFAMVSKTYGMEIRG